MKRAVTVIVVVLLVLITCLLIIILTIGEHRSRDWLITAVNQRSGRTLEIADLDISLSMQPAINLKTIRLANTPWASSQSMIEIERLRITIDLWQLLKGRLVIPELELHSPLVALEKSAQGHANWRFDEGLIADAALPDDRTEVPTILRLRIHNAQFDFHDAIRNFDLSGHLRSVVMLPDDKASIKIVAEGTLQNSPFDLQLVSGSFERLRNNDADYPVDLAVHLGDTFISALGSLHEPLQLRGFNLSLRAEGPDASRLMSYTGAPVPATPPYRVSGDLTRTAEHWSIDNLVGEVGDSDIAGDISLDTSEKLPVVTARLRSRKLDFDDLGPLVGAPPGTGPGETASEQQQIQARQLAQSEKVIPRETFNLDALRAANADITFTGDSFLGTGTPLQSLEISVQLVDGEMTLNPLQLRMAGGSVDGAIIADARTENFNWQYDLKISDLALGALIETEVIDDMAQGVLKGSIRLQSQGDSMHRLAANSSGEIALEVIGGRLSNLLIELIGLDIAESLGLIASNGEQGLPFRCALANFEVQQGRMNSRLLVVDTSDTRINGELAVDLGSETFDLVLKPEPKDFSLFSAKAPLEVSGNFKDIDLRPNLPSLGLRIGTAGLLGAIATPLTALLAFIEPGTGRDADCNQLRQSIGANSMN